MAGRSVFAQDTSMTSTWQMTPNVVIKTFDQTNGLPTVSLSDIVMGADGYLYVASYAGLSRFDGSKFELITSEQYPSLQSNRILHVYAAPDSAIWFVDEEGRISRWKEGHLQTFRSLARTGKQAWRIKISKSGSVWAVKRNEARVFKDGFGFKKLHYTFPDSVIDFMPVTDENGWIFTKKGLLEYNKGKLLTRVLPPVHYPFSAIYTKIRELPLNRMAIYDSHNMIIYDMAKDSAFVYRYADPNHLAPLALLILNANHYIISTYTAYYNLDFNRSVIHEIPGIANQYIGPASYNPNWLDKRLYVTYNKVIFNNHIIFDAGTGIQISQCAQDKEGNLWLTTNGKGLKRITISPFQVLNKHNGLPADNMYSVVEDAHKNIWAGAFDGGIYRIHNRNIAFWNGNLIPESNQLIHSLYCGKLGHIYAGVWGWGVKIFNGHSWKNFKLIASSVAHYYTFEAYFQDRNGNFWFGTREGLFKKIPHSTRIRQVYSIDNRPVKGVRVISRDARHRLWFGTDGDGIYLWNHHKLRHVPLGGTFSNLAVRDIFTKRPDTLWIATEKHGLIRAKLDYEGDIIKYKILGHNDGLPDIGVHRILADPYGYFWLPSNQGLSRINEKKLNQYLNGDISQLWIQTFNENDGLPIREANGGTQSCGLVASDSTIWVPTQKGIIHFNPKQFLGKNPYRFTKIILSHIKTKDHSYNIFDQSAITLPSDNRTMTITFSLLHYTNPKYLTIEYRIPTLQTGWNILTSKRQLNVTNMPPGTNIIEIRLAGVPDNLFPVASFSITIPPFFYEQIWFKVLISLLSIGLIVLGFISIHESGKRREQTLNKKVHERTSELRKQKENTEQALATIRQQAETLERLNQAKMDFFINITHELRTPLTLIKGPLELLKEATYKQNIDREELLHLIERNSNRLNKLVDRLLELLRMETDQQAEDIEKVDLTNFIRHVASQYESSENMIGKTMEIHVPARAVYITISPRSLESIANNLISNAIKYTNEGDIIDIIVSLSDNSPVLEIKDTGIGIDKKDLQYIFDPFYRARNVSNLQGSGIGLSIVKRYMKKIGGKVTIASEFGKGTSVRLIFPVNSNDTLEENSSYAFETTLSSASKKDMEIRQITSNLKQNVVINSKTHILVIDDNEDLRIFLSRLLEEKYKVTAVENAHNALSLLETKEPDLILTDIMMPDMDGISLTRKIRSIERLQFIPIIILSAKKTEQSITEGLQAGAQVFLTKPVENRILLAQVETLLSREKRIGAFRETNHLQFSSRNEGLTNQINTLILRHLSDPNLNIETISEALHMSRSTLYRKWKSVSDLNLNEYIMQTRLNETVLLIKEKNYTFTEASGVCGFSEPAYFSRVFKKHYGKTPSDYFSTKNI